MMIDVLQSKNIQKNTLPDHAPKKDDPYFTEMAKNTERGFMEHIPINFVFKALADQTSYTL